MLGPSENAETASQGISPDKTSSPVPELGDVTQADSGSVCQRCDHFLRDCVVLDQNVKDYNNLVKRLVMV